MAAAGIVAIIDGHSMRMSFNVVITSLGVNAICDTGAKNPLFVVFGFFIESYSTLHRL